MSNPVVGPAIAISPPHLAAGSTAARPSEATSFASLVARGRDAQTQPPGLPAPPHAGGADGSSIGAMGRALLARISRGERYVDGVVHQGLAGRAFNNGELLVMQAQVYRYSQDLDLASRLVDKATSAVRTVLTQNG